MLEFKKDFLNKIEATIKEYKTNSDYSPFLKHFGSYKAMSLDKQYEFMDVVNSNIMTILDKVSYINDYVLLENFNKGLKREVDRRYERQLKEREEKRMNEEIEKIPAKHNKET